MSLTKALSFLVLVSHLTSALALRPRDVDCSFSTSPNTGEDCTSFASDWGLTVDQLEALNPGVACPDIDPNQLYCVVGTVESSTSTTTMTSTSKTSATTKKTSITPTPTPTPSPTKTKSTTTSSLPPDHQPQQPGLAANCNNFYLVQGGDTCNNIEAKYGISAKQFSTWNPSINTDCTNLLSGYYVCVGVPGSSSSKSTPTKTTTSKSGNGISTPTPTQSGMVSNCDEFYMAKSGDTCQAISDKHSIPLSKFTSWNPAVGSSCGSLFVGYYYCVDTTDYTPPSKTTSAGNGITTPTPYEKGMVNNCDTFYLVRSGDTCSTIASKKGVTVKQIEKWNPHVGSSCTSLYANDYICIGVR